MNETLSDTFQLMLHKPGESGGASSRIDGENQLFVKCMVYIFHIPPAMSCMHNINHLYSSKKVDMGWKREGNNIQDEAKLYVIPFPFLTHILPSLLPYKPFVGSCHGYQVNRVKYIILIKCLLHIMYYILYGREVHCQYIQPEAPR